MDLNAFHDAQSSVSCVYAPHGSSTVLKIKQAAANLVYMQKQEGSALNNYVKEMTTMLFARTGMSNYKART